MEELYGHFAVAFDDGMLSINPEMAPAASGFSPTGRYHVYCLHPDHGSCTFYIEMDDDGNWTPESKPPFISEDFIKWIGHQIEEYHA